MSSRKKSKIPFLNSLAKNLCCGAKERDCIVPFETSAINRLDYNHSNHRQSLNSLRAERAAADMSQSLTQQSEMSNQNEDTNFDSSQTLRSTSYDSNPEQTELPLDDEPELSPQPSTRQEHESAKTSRPNNQNDKNKEEDEELEQRLSYDGLPILEILNAKHTIDAEEIDRYIDNTFEESFMNILFFANATRTDAIKHLTDVEKGGYCIRRKLEKSRKPYVISVKIDDTSINHLWIRVCLHTVSKLEETNEQSETNQNILEDRNYLNQTEQQLNPDSNYDAVHEPLDLTNDNDNHEEEPVYESTDLPISKQTGTKPDPIVSRKPKQTQTEIRYGYHIDSGQKMFKNLFELLKYYENANLGNMFHKCGVTMKCIVDLDDYNYEVDEGTGVLSIVDTLERSQCSRSTINLDAQPSSARKNDMSDKNRNKTNNNSSTTLDNDQKDLTINQSVASIQSLDDKPRESDGFIRHRNKKYKIKQKNVKIAYDFTRQDFSNLKDDKNVFKRLDKGSLIQILYDNDQEAVTNNWLKCYYGESVLYAPKNFVIG